MDLVEDQTATQSDINPEVHPLIEQEKFPRSARGTLEKQIAVIDKELTRVNSLSDPLGTYGVDRDQAQREHSAFLQAMQNRRAVMELTKQGVNADALLNLDQTVLLEKSLPVLPNQNKAEQAQSALIVAAFVNSCK